MEESYKQITFLSPVCTDNLGISCPPRCTSGYVSIAGVAEGRIALTSFPIPYAVCCPAQHNPTKNIPLARESELLGGFNRLPLLDFSTVTATKRAGPRVQSDLKTSSRAMQELQPLHCCNSLSSADGALLKPRWTTQLLSHQCQLLGRLPQQKQQQGVQAGRASKGDELLV